MAHTGHSILAIFIFLEIISGEILNWEFLDVVPLDILEDELYCQVIINLPKELDYERPNIANQVHISGHPTDCMPTLNLQRLEDFKKQTCDLKLRNHFVKKPNETFIFWNLKNEKLDQIFDKKRLKILPCLLVDQPYFFVLTQNQSLIRIDEVQVFAHTIVPIFVAEIAGNKWVVTLSKSISQRRSDFHGVQLKVHFDNDEKYGFVDGNEEFKGYNGELGTILKNEFNLTLDLIPIKIYGVKLSNGSYSGTVKELMENKIDMGLASFDNIIERLEVIEAGFTALKVETKIIYWKDATSGSKMVFGVFGMVFSPNLWLGLLIMITISSLYLFILSQCHIKAPHLFTDHIQPSFITNIKALFAQGPDDNLNDSQMSSMRLYLLSICLCGAIVFWCYSGLLVSVFTADSEEQPIKSFEDLTHQPNLKLALFKGAAESQPYITAIQKNPGLEQALKSSIIWKDRGGYGIDEFVNGPDRKNLMILGAHKMFYHSILQVDIGDKLCNVKVGNLEGVKGSIKSGWIYPRNSILKGPFDTFLLHMSQSGMERKIYEKYWGFLDTIECGNQEYSPLELDIVMVLFKMLAFGLGVALLLLFSEHLFKCLKYKLT